MSEIEFKSLALFGLLIQFANLAINFGLFGKRPKRPHYVFIAIGSLISVFCLLITIFR